jgi:hypothetical protein
MPKFEVTIRVQITKTYTVDADDADQAIETANDVFSVLDDEAEDDYTQETLYIIELKGDNHAD